MAKLRIYGDIVDNEEKEWLSYFGIDGVSYTDIADFINSMDDDDDEIDIRIFCRGGSCMQGWAIYDALRQSGKTIKTTIEGQCSSMATIILLAAPKERRYAFRNSSLCAHYPAAAYLPITWSEERLTAEKLREQAKELENYAVSLDAEAERILSLYVERTGSERSTLEALMAQDKFVDMETALELGFIGSILPEITDIKAIRKFITNNSTTNKMKVLRIQEDKAQKICAMFGVEKLEDLENFKMVDQVITSVSGETFTVEREDGDPQVGDKASPDGEFTLEDGTVIVIADGVITEIRSDEEDGEGEGEGGEGEGEGGEGGEGTEELTIDQAKAMIDDLQAQIDDLKAKLDLKDTEAKEKDTTIEDLNAQVTSLTESQMTDEQREICEVVDKAGGKEWLDKVVGMRSTFNPGNRKFVAHRAPGEQMEEGGESKTRKAIRERRERYAARKNQD